MDSDHKTAFAEVRNFLAGRMLGVTRDQSLLEEVMKCLFAFKKIDSSVRRVPTDPLKLAALYRDVLQGMHVPFAETDQLLLDAASISFVHSKFARLKLFEANRDPVGDLYEAFIGSAIRGADGQFFTPLNAIEWLTEAVGLREGMSVIDPACGAGGFLMAAGRSGLSLDIVGMEKDSYLADLARARMQVLDLPADVHCANSLTLKQKGGTSLRHLVGQFDVVLANPPFGKNIRSVDEKEQSEFSLGHKWVRRHGTLLRTDSLTVSVPPQVLFVERILSLLRAGGTAGIVVPESLISGRSYAHVVNYIKDNASIDAVVGMPESLFKHSGKGGTHTKTCLMVLTKAQKTTKVYMAEAVWCGHDSRGRRIDRDDLPTTVAEYTAFRDHGGSAKLTFGYVVQPDAIEGNVLAPRYHEPTALLDTAGLLKTHDLISVADLVSAGELELASGNEVGKLAYGGGAVPFVRTSDLSGWEIKADPKHLVSDDVYARLRRAQDVREGDILMVRDGTYLIGTCAYVTRHDEKIVYQSHILKFRCAPKARVSSHLLIALLSSEPVQRQIRSKTFTQDIINSLGNRVSEIVLPVPKSVEVRKKIEGMVKKVIDDRIEARELSRIARRAVVDLSLVS